MNSLRSRVLLAACLLSLPTSSALQAREKGLLQLDRIYDFGCIGIEFNVYHDFKLVNLSSAPVRLDSVYAKCDCSRVMVYDSIVAPGDTLEIGIEFNTESYYGPTSKAMHVFSNNSATPHLKFYYLTTVGQWLLGFKPNPISVFILPGHSSKKVTIRNIATERADISEIDLYNDLVDVTIVKARAAKGEYLELEVVPKAGLSSGTYVTNFRVTIDVPEIEDPVLVSIPVKIVRY